jgi:hypothetical protein
MYLRQITNQDLAELLKFAQSRLAALGLAVSQGQDVVQRALESILLGLVPGETGRRPRSMDVADKAAFRNYLRGAVASKAEALTRQREARQPHLTYDDGLASVEIALSRTPATEAEISDFGREFFDRLRHLAPARLQESISAWEAEYPDADRIPTVRGQRKYGVELRRLARKVVFAIDGFGSAARRERRARQRGAILSDAVHDRRKATSGWDTRDTVRK